MRTLLIIYVFVIISKEIVVGDEQPLTEAPILRTTTNEQRECIWACPKTSEYNPICGTDGVRYYNIGYLTCAQECGVSVNPTHPPPCTGSTSTTVIPLPPLFGRV